MSKFLWIILLAISLSFMSGCRYLCSPTLFSSATITATIAVISPLA